MHAPAFTETETMLNKKLTDYLKTTPPRSPDAIAQWHWFHFDNIKELLDEVIAKDFLTSLNLTRKQDTHVSTQAFREYLTFHELMFVRKDEAHYFCSQVNIGWYTPGYWQKQTHHTLTESEQQQIEWSFTFPETRSPRSTPPSSSDTDSKNQIVSKSTLKLESNLQTAVSELQHEQNKTFTLEQQLRELQQKNAQLEAERRTSAQHLSRPIKPKPLSKPKKLASNLGKTSFDPVLKSFAHLSADFKTQPPTQSFPQ